MTTTVFTTCFMLSDSKIYRSSTVIHVNMMEALNLVKVEASKTHISVKNICLLKKAKKKKKQSIQKEHV